MPRSNKNSRKYNTDYMINRQSRGINRFRGYLNTIISYCICFSAANPEKLRLYSSLNNNLLARHGRSRFSVGGFVVA